MQLVVENVTQHYDHLVRFGPWNFTVPSGSALIVTGDNGSGKSTLLRTLAGLMPPHQGQVRFDGGMPDASIAEQCHHVAYLNAVKPELTAAENLAQWAGILGHGPEALTAEAALDRLGMAAFLNTPAGYLSTGLKRRLALARLLVAPRPLWLLDEPTAALDMAACRAVADVIGEHLDDGGLAVIATHLDLELDGQPTLDLTPASAAT